MHSSLAIFLLPFLSIFCRFTASNFTASFFRFIQHVPETFLASPVASASIQCALAASVLDHRDAFSSVMKFFRDLLTLGKNGDLVSLGRREGGEDRVCVCEEGGEGGERNRERELVLCLQIEADKMQRQAVVSSFIAEHGATIMDRKFSKETLYFSRSFSYNLLFVPLPSLSLLKGLVQGYVTLPTYMLTESTEVLWTFLEQSKEVKIPWSGKNFAIQYNIARKVKFSVRTPSFCEKYFAKFFSFQIIISTLR